MIKDHHSVVIKRVEPRCMKCSLSDSFYTTSWHWNVQYYVIKLVTCDRLMVFSASLPVSSTNKTDGHNNWNIVESGIKHHQANKKLMKISTIIKLNYILHGSQKKNIFRLTKSGQMTITSLILKSSDQFNFIHRTSL